ncbi:MAG TPA: hypothetical protein VMV50_02355 [Candidatus Paceibacterota bacterium]|nr:hypothetical protein [Candidatus Paceibacterota bacterium]
MSNDDELNGFSEESGEERVPRSAPGDDDDGFTPEEEPGKLDEEEGEDW